MANKLGKHTPYFELVDAQALPGCPVCRLAYKATDRYLDSLLYEAVLDPDVRAKLKSAQGFCSRHAEMLTRRPGRALGVALIYRDIIRTLAERLAEGEYRPAPSVLDRLLGREHGAKAVAEALAQATRCPACIIAEQSENTYLDLMLAHITDDTLYRAYAEGEGLCLPHLIGALERVSDAEAFRRLVEPQGVRYRAMLHDLDEFIRKHDHRFKGEKFGEEGDVWLRAMNAVLGGAGMGLSARSGGRRSDDIDQLQR
ncbi:MAG TPA: hypothetical protein GX714_11970 [Chloroflexi bacterium]|nr:hypothetical protein [Chloroflexota bacterium]